MEYISTKVTAYGQFVLVLLSIIQINFIYIFHIRFTRRQIHRHGGCFFFHAVKTKKKRKCALHKKLVSGHLG